MNSNHGSCLLKYNTTKEKTKMKLLDNGATRPQRKAYQFDKKLIDKMNKTGFPTYDKKTVH